MNTIATTAPARSNISIRNGILAGLAGGIIFGILMQMMGMMTMLAGIMGSKSDVVGWMMHLMISAIFGLIYGVLAFKISSKWAVSGLVYGMILWVAGPLVMMPMMMGMPLFMFTGMTWMSLMGHMIFGVVTAWSFSKLSR
jgi:uncharacterized membrane protein YagU involved in acid resistance